MGNKYTCIYDAISTCMIKRYFRFLKAHFTLFGFYERRTLVPVFAKWKKSELDFNWTLPKKVLNQEYSSVCFIRNLDRGS